MTRRHRSRLLGQNAGVVAAAFGALLAINSLAVAQPCRSVLYRPVSEVLPSNGSAVSVMSGERICLRLGAGERPALAMATSTPALDISLSVAGSNSVLRLYNPWTVPLEYGIFEGDPSQSVATRMGIVGPQSVGIDTWSGAVPQITLSGFRILPKGSYQGARASGPSDRAALLPSPHEKFQSWTSLYLFHTVYRSQLTRLDSELRQHGYSSLPSNQGVMGLVIDFGNGKFRNTSEFSLFGTSHYARISDSKRFGVGRLSFSFLVGRDVYRNLGFSVFPMVGIGFGLLRVSVDPETPAFLSDELRAQPDKTTITFGFGEVQAGLGVEEVVPVKRSSTSDHGIVFGVRAGYVQQFTRSSWSQGEQDLPAVERSGARASVSGPYLRFSIGWAEYVL